MQHTHIYIYIYIIYYIYSISIGVLSLAPGLSYWYSCLWTLREASLTKDKQFVQQLVRANNKEIINALILHIKGECGSISWRHNADYLPLARAWSFAETTRASLCSTGSGYSYGGSIVKNVILQVTNIKSPNIQRRKVDSEKRQIVSFSNK